MDRARARLEEMLQAARRIPADLMRWGAGSTPSAKLERDILVDSGLRRLAELDLGDEALVFGRIDRCDHETFYIGRVGVHDETHEPVVVDWRAPVAEPFYRATPKSPMGLSRRRHFMTRGPVITGIDDELLDAPRSDGRMVLVGEAALMEALQRSRTGRMRDIVSTIQAEQDEVIRAPLQGVLIVQGGPGTGKTAVALHRAAYMLYTHRALLQQRGVLLVGPSPAFLGYIEQVLPSLGEQTVTLATTASLVSGFEVTAIDEPEVARIKGDSRMAVVTKNAVAGLSRPLVQPETLKLDETSPLRLDGFRLTITPADSRAMVSLVSKLPGPHNENRPEMEDLVVDHLMRQWVREWQARTGDDTGSYPRAAFKRELLSGSDFGRVVDLMWPVMTPGRLVSGLLSGESALSASQEVLSDRERELLRREEHRGWTVHDAPLLDEAAVLLGTVPGARSRRKPERESDEWAAEEMVEDLASAASFRGSPDAPGMMDPLMRREVAQRMVDRMRDEEWEPPDRERETFGHVLVDEAQDLSPMQWRMIQRRCPSRSMTLLGDLAQAGGPLQPQTWHEVAGWAGSGPASEVELTINYRTPAQIMAVAERVLSATQPGVRPPRAVRETGFEPVFLAAQDAAEEAVRVAREEQSEVGDGTVAVIAPVGMARNIASAIGPSETISVLTADEAKGLEFDSVVVVEPARIAVTSSGGLRSLYVALTRPTQRLTVVHAEPLPPTLAAS